MENKSDLKELLQRLSDVGNPATKSTTTFVKFHLKGYDDANQINLKRLNQ